MTKKTKYIVLSVLLGVLLLLGGLKFRVPLYDAFLSVFPSKQIVLEQKRGIPRTISYIGRIKEAERLIENQYYGLATLEINEAIKAKPNLLRPYLLMAELHLRQNAFSQLQNLIDGLAKRFPENPEVVALEVRKLIAEQEFGEATQILTDDVLAQSATLKFYAALLKSLQNDHQAAEQLLSEVDDLDVESDELAVSEQGVTDVQKSGKADIEIYEKARRLIAIYEEFTEFTDGKTPHLFALVSKSLAENNESHLAREFAAVALKEDPQYTDGWVLKGYSEFLLQNYDQALLNLKQAYELDPIRPETHYFLALALEKLGQTSEAALFFEKSLEHEFEFSNEVQWKLIEIFTKQKKYDQVVELYREVVQQNPDPNQFVPVIYTSIDILKKPELALEISEDLLEENPTDALALNLHGWALIANKKFAQAEEILEQAKDINATNPRTFLNLGLLAERQEQFAEAIELYKQSYELGKAQPFNSVTNLAADRYNQLLESQPPQPLEAPDRQANSP